MQRLSGLDAAFLALETPSMHMHVAAVLVFEPQDDSPSAVHLDRIREVFEERIHTVPLLRKRAVRIPFGLNHPVWVDDPDFDLGYHLRRACLPSPGGPPDLAAFVGELVERPLDQRRPLWELHLVEGLDSGHLAAIVKLHHAMIDGVSGADIMASFLDLAPVSPRVATPAEKRRHELVPSDPELVAWAVSSLVRHPDRALDALKNTLGAARKLAERNRRLREEDELDPPPAPFRAPRTSLNGAISAHRRYAFTQFQLEDLWSIRRSFGGTINDVLLACVAGALRRLLEERGEQLDHPLVAMVPMSARRRIGGEVPIGGELLAANRVSAMLVSLATSVADPVVRLRLIAEGTRLAKEQARVITEEVIRGWAQISFPMLSSRLARLSGNLRLFDHVRPVFNVVISNIPGPELPLWLAGARLVGVYPVGPIIEGVGLNVTAFSYLGVLYIGLLGCRELVPEVDHLAVLLSDSLGELAKAALQSGNDWS